MSSGMNLEQAKEYAKTMTYKQAIGNVISSKGIKYRKATMIKLRELAEIADKLDGKTELQKCGSCNHYKLTCDLFSEICKYEPKTEPQNECTDCECTDDCTECKEAEHGCKDEPQTIKALQDFYGIKAEPTLKEMAEPQTDGYMTAEQTEDYRKMLDKAVYDKWGNVFDARADIDDEPQTDTDFTLTYTCNFSNCKNFKHFGFSEKCIECKCKQSEAKWKIKPQIEDIKSVKALQEYFGIKREPNLSEMIEEESRTEETQEGFYDEYYRDHDEFYDSEHGLWFRSE